MKEIQALRYVTPVLLALGMILAIANWYLTPARSGAWAITLGLLVFLVVPLTIARRLGKPEGSTATTVYVSPTP